MLLLDTSNNLRTTLLGETEEGHEAYSGALGLCNMSVYLHPLLRLLIRVYLFIYFAFIIFFFGH